MSASPPSPRGFWPTATALSLADSLPPPAPRYGFADEEQLLEIAHREYVRVPNEPHLDRLRRVIRALMPMMRGGR